MHKVLGRFNEIAEDAVFGDGTIITNYCYIGKGVKIGKNCKISNFAEINSGVTIGDNVLINPYCSLNSDTRVGNNTAIGNSTITIDEKYMTSITSNIRKKPCVIGNHVNIGAGARLMCTSIGDYAMIGAGSVILADHVPGHEVWVGTPARKIRNTTPEEDQLSHGTA